MTFSQLLYRCLMAQGSLALIDKQLKVLAKELTSAMESDRVCSVVEGDRDRDLLSEYDRERANKI